MAVSNEIMELLRVDGKCSTLFQRVIGSGQVKTPHIDKKCVNELPFETIRQVIISSKCLLSVDGQFHPAPDQLHQGRKLTLTFSLALANCPNAMPKRKSGPKNVMMARLNLSRSGWYHLSVGEPAFGYVVTQQHSIRVNKQDHKMSKEPRSLLFPCHPTSCSRSEALTLMVGELWSLEGRGGRCRSLKRASS